MKLRIGALALILALVSVFAVVPAGTTHAAPVRPATVTPSGLPATFTYGGGTGTINSITFTGVQLVNGVLQATGYVTGTYTPSTGPNAGIPQALNSTNGAFTAPLDPPAGCQILDLTVGAIHLDLLGLVVTTNPIHLNITAQPGPGNLLGNLLCAVTHLLDNTGSGAGLNALLGNIATLLNQLLGGLTL